MIYLDNAATTYPKPDVVWETVDWVQRNIPFNAGRGGYAMAAKASQIIEDTRTAMAQFVDVPDADRVVFTPSATYAANAVILGLNWDGPKNVYLTPFAHNAVARPLHRMCVKTGSREHWIPFMPETHAWDAAATQRMFLTAPPDYVFLDHVSNVTGTVLPVEKIAAMAKSFGAVVVVDGSQSLGLLDISLRDTAIDFLLFAGHKSLYGSWGVGGWIRSGNVALKPMLAGGTGSDSLQLAMSERQPMGFEPGSHNVIAIASLGASLGWLKETGIHTIAGHERALLQQMKDGLQREGIVLYTPDAEIQQAGILSFNIHGYEPDEVGVILDGDYGIAVRTGYHCAPYIHDFLGTRETLGTVRASLSYFSTERDVDALVWAVAELEKEGAER